ncbi:MAG: hypothetical protein C9356_15825 [Oleiphilus sp.]|nr:MAG: hypothetical protein C9356_15825 [Oleiphilus sp.]
MKYAICLPSFQLPGNIESLEDLWRALIHNEPVYARHQPRFSPEGFEIDQQHLDPFEWFGAISHIAEFDGQAFGMSRVECSVTDPQHRLLLQHAVVALDHAGINYSDTQDSKTGVYIGLCSRDYAELMQQHRVPFLNNPYFAIGNTPSTAAGRIAHKLNLTGPAIAFDTACSSSGVALGTAISDLAAGNCDSALVAASNLILSPYATGAFNAARMLSPSHRCRPFARDADGYVRSEAVVAFVVRRLDDALADNTPILAVLNGIAVNQDGKGQVLTAPNSSAQVECIERCLSRSQLNASDIALVEAHGTGTVAGDQAELDSFSAIFAQPITPYIAASKGILGHTETSASIVGLLCAAECIRRKTATPYCVPEKDRVESAKRGGLRFADGPIPIEAEDFHALVVSYGYSGTNVAMTLSPSPTELPKKYSAITASMAFEDRFRNRETFWFDSSTVPAFESQLPGLTDYRLDDDEIAFLKLHIVDSSIIVPMAFYLQVAMKKASPSSPDNHFELASCEVLAACQYSDNTQFRFSQTNDLFTIVAIEQAQTEKVFQCRVIERSTSSMNDLHSGPSGRTVPPSAVYRWLEQLGFTHQGKIAQFSDVSVYENILRTSVTGNNRVALLDCAIQAAVCFFYRLIPELLSNNLIFMPTKVGLFRVSDSNDISQIEVVPRQSSQHSFQVDICLADSTGTVIGFIEALRFDTKKRHQDRSLPLYRPRMISVPILNELQAFLQPNCSIFYYAKDASLFHDHNCIHDEDTLYTTVSNELSKAKPLLLTYVIDNALTHAQKIAAVGKLVSTVNDTRSSQLIAIQIVSFNEYYSPPSQQPSETFELLKATVLSQSIEYPHINLKYLDVDVTDPKGWRKPIIEEGFAFVNTNQNDDLIVVRTTSTRLVYRIHPTRPHVSIPQFPLAHFEAPRPGAVALTTTETKMDQVRVRVLYSGINFRDALKAKHLYPGDTKLGSEFLGVVQHDDSGTYRPGQYVLGFHEGAFSDVVWAGPLHLVPIADVDADPRLAGVAVTGLSAYYAIAKCGDLNKKRVLVHNATGGLGLALIELLRPFEVVILATAHGETKQNYLGQIGIQHVADSRNSEEIARFKMVDIVFFTLDSGLLTATLETMTENAILIDFTLSHSENEQIVSAHSSNVRYIPFHLQNELASPSREVVSALRKLTQTNYWKEIPTRAWNCTQLPAALTHLQEPEHIGKNLLSWPSETAIILITGGTSKLVSYLAPHLANSSRVLLVGRTPAQDIPLHTSNMLDPGKIDYFQCDCTDADQLSNFHQKLRTDNLAITEIYHFAGFVIQEKSNAIDPKSFEALYKAKVEALRLLIAEFDSIVLRQVVAVSSMASVIGSPGQSSYASINAIQERVIAGYGVSGKLGKVMYFPPVSGTDMQANTSPSVEAFVPPLTQDQFVEGFSVMLAHPESHLAYGHIADKSYGLKQPHLVEVLRSRANRASISRPSIAGATEGDDLTEKEVVTYLKQLAKECFDYLDRTEFDDETALSEQDIDSLGLMEFATRVEDFFSMSIPQEGLSKTTSLKTLAQFITASKTKEN